MIPMSFEERLTALAERVGDEHRSVQDGHARWGIYSQAIQITEAWPELLELLKDEPDKSIASSAIVNLLEVLPESRRSDFVSVLPAGRIRDYAATRAQELLVLENLPSRGSVPDAEPSVLSWSAWLQLRAANSAENGHILEILSTAGATKRIRSAARERLRLLGPSSD